MRKAEHFHRFTKALTVTEAYLPVTDVKNVLDKLGDVQGRIPKHRKRLERRRLLPRSGNDYLTSSKIVAESKS